MAICLLYTRFHDAAQLCVSLARHGWRQYICEDSLKSSQLSFLLPLCTREHDTHHDVVNAQAPCVPSHPETVLICHPISFLSLDLDSSSVLVCLRSVFRYMVQPARKV